MRYESVPMTSVRGIQSMSRLARTHTSHESHGSHLPRGTALAGRLACAIVMAAWLCAVVEAGPPAEVAAGPTAITQIIFSSNRSGPWRISEARNPTGRPSAN